MDIIRTITVHPVLDLFGDPMEEPVVESGKVTGSRPTTTVDLIKGLIGGLPREDMTELLTRGARVADAIMDAQKAIAGCGVVRLLKEDHEWLVQKANEVKPFRSAAVNMALVKLLGEFTEEVGSTADGKVGGLRAVEST
jgi:hypothetical protein